MYHRENIYMVVFVNVAFTRFFQPWTFKTQPVLRKYLLRTGVSLNLNCVFEMVYILWRGPLSLQSWVVSSREDGLRDKSCYGPYGPVCFHHFTFILHCHSLRCSATKNTLQECHRCNLSPIFLQASEITSFPLFYVLGLVCQLFFCRIEIVKCYFAGKKLVC